MAQDAIGERPADRTGRALGIAVFLLGVVLLVVVFALAYRDLIAAVDGVTFSRLLTLPAMLIFKGSLLLVMGLVASAISNKGIALYDAARQKGEG